MTDLIKRLEDAEAGSRELDREIMALFYRTGERTIGIECDCCPDGNHVTPVWVDPLTGEWKTTALDGFEFTTSPDAALALAERVLPPDPAFHPQTPSVGWKINLYRGMIPTDQKGGWFANVRRHATDGFEGASTSPALALCIAVLKATDIGREE